MAHARLHLICGNCGCSDHWEWEHIPEEEDYPEDVFIWCKNCTTLHSLNANAKVKEK